MEAGLKKGDLLLKRRFDAPFFALWNNTNEADGAEC